MINIKQPKTQGVGILKRPSFSRDGSLFTVDAKIEFQVEDEAQAEAMASWGIIPAAMWAEHEDSPMDAVKRSFKGDNRYASLFLVEDGKEYQLIEDLPCEIRGTEYKVARNAAKYTMSVRIHRVTASFGAKFLQAIDRVVEVHLENDQQSMFDEPQAVEEMPVKEFQPKYHAGDLIAGNQGLMSFYGVVKRHDQDKGVLFDTLQDGSADIEALDNYVDPAEINLWIKTASSEEDMGVSTLVNYYISRAESKGKIPNAEYLVLAMMREHGAGAEVPNGDEWMISRKVVSRALSI